MPDTAANNHRSRAMGMAVLSSLLSKGGNALLMLVSIPLAFRVLGEERFGVYGVVQTLMFFITMSDLGMGPGIMRRIAEAVARGDREEETAVMSCGFYITLGFVSVAASIFITLMLTVPVTTLFGSGFAPVASELEKNLWVAGLLFLMSLLVSMLERAREGYQEIHIGNYFGAAQNVASAVILFFGLAYWPSVFFLLMAIYGTQAFFGMANAVSLLLKRPWLIPRFSSVRRLLARQMVGEGIALFTAGTMSPILQREGTKWLLGLMMGPLGPTVSGRYTILIQLGFFLYGFVLMISRPLWPAVADAVARGDLAWVRAARARITKGFLLMAVLTVSGFVTLGPWLAEAWLHKKVDLDRLDYALFSLSFVLMVWSHFHYVILAGVGKIRQVAQILAMETATVLLLAWLGIQWFGLSGALAATGLGTACFSAWWLPALLQRFLSHPEVPPPSPDQQIAIDPYPSSDDPASPMA